MVHSVPTQRIKPRRLLNYAARVSGLSFLRDAYAGWNRLEDSVGTWRAVSELSRRESFDVVEVADFSALGFWGTLRPRRPTPILVRSHGYQKLDLPGWNQDGARFQLALERYSVRHADFVLAASIERVSHYQAIFDVEPLKVGALPYGISMPGPPSFDAPVGQDAKVVTVLYIGRVELRKGCDVLFEALGIAHGRRPSIRAVFIGPIAEDMMHAFAAFLEETASWTQYQGTVPQEQITACLREGDMIVLPSRFETLPRVLIEALAAGVPQVATPVNGIPEIVDDGVTGILVEPDNPEALAAAIERLSASPELRSMMAQRSRARAFEKFDIEKVMPRQVEVYRALVEGRSPLEALAQ
jgi:glycosyltransferase involved in cell wall biosynthesis